ncbi:NAD(P)H-dependent oxidoreductase [Hyphococcus sp.]|uniref:NAD(P)H-dependent oxidoreductase n=1 Tax=Hyphococcus sp. TaxID=2038636 RepID=UPI0035C6DB21
MGETICIIDGHPHRGKGHLCHALAEAYKAGAKDAGHKVTTLTLADMDINFLRDPADFETPASGDIAKAQKAVSAASHIVVVYPLWLGTMPALVKAFFEQFARGGFAIQESEHGWPAKMLKGKSARVIVTMGMPAAAYKVFFGAHGVKGFESGILGMSGFKPVRETLIGGAGALSDKRAASLFGRMRALGAKAS